MQDPQIGEAAQLGRYCLVELIVAEVQFSQIFQTPNSVGIAPVSSLSLRYSRSRLVRLPSAAGMVSLSMLLLRMSSVRLTKSPNSAGIAPDNWLFSRRSSSSTDWSPSLARSAGINPSKALS